MLEHIPQAEYILRRDCQGPISNAVNFKRSSYIFYDFRDLLEVRWSEFSSHLSTIADTGRFSLL